MSIILYKNKVKYHKNIWLILVSAEWQGVNVKALAETLYCHENRTEITVFVNVFYHKIKH